MIKANRGNRRLLYIVLKCMDQQRILSINMEDLWALCVLNCITNTVITKAFMNVILLSVLLLRLNLSICKSVYQCLCPERTMVYRYCRHCKTWYISDLIEGVVTVSKLSSKLQGKWFLPHFPKTSAFLTCYHRKSTLGNTNSKGVDHFTIWLPRLLVGFPIKMQSVICSDD